jgi:phosphoglycolate phosphatase
MKYTHIIWDFNGTIMDDVRAGIDNVNTMLAERGLATIDTVERYREIFDFPIEDYYRSLGFDFEREPYEVLAPIWVALYEINSKQSPLTPCLAETLAEVKRLGVEQIVLSACEINMLRRNLESYGVLEHFSEVIGLDNIHARSKLHLAKQWRAEHPEARALMIGDTTHEFEVARVMDVDCVLYSGGHQSRRKLSSCQCPIIDNISDLLKFLK